jgi:hypothetical protein
MLAVVFPLLLFFAVLAFVAIFAFRQRATHPLPVADWPFQAKSPLTQAEQVLYHRLVAALPEHIILAQVQLSRVLGVKPGFNFNEWNNRINRLSYDFVVCRKDSSVVAAIELDDKTHERPARVAADRRKEQATASARIKLIRWQVSALPDSAAIRREIAQPAVAAQGRSS